MPILVLTISFNAYFNVHFIHFLNKHALQTSKQLWITSILSYSWYELDLHTRPFYVHLSNSKFFAINCVSSSSPVPVVVIKMKICVRFSVATSSITMRTEINEKNNEMEHSLLCKRVLLTGNAVTSNPYTGMLKSFTTLYFAYLL